MKFLHEYNVLPNGTAVDNGWWEIRGDRCVNMRGAGHPYTPSPNDEIKESTWDKIIAETVRDDSEKTGWISPDGEFFGCAPMDHDSLAWYVIGKTQRELELAGWCKIYRSMFDHKRGYYCEKFLSPGQRKVLMEKDVEIKEYDMENW